MQKLGHIAYNKLEGKSPTIVFIHGFKSDMEGTKAVFLEAMCRALGHGFVRFDCSGHGKSGGKFEDGTISLWRDDTLKVIDELTSGEIIIVGSSMGAWLMLLAAIARPKRLKALVGIASAPDFTENLVWERFTKEQQKEFTETGKVLIPNCYDDQEGYAITKNLLEDGRKNLLLKNKINITCPVRLIHGMKDEDVPYKTSEQIAEKLASDDVQIHLVKNGDHRMSAVENLELLKAQVLDMIYQ